MSQLPAENSGLLRARRVLSLAPGVEGDAVWWQAGRVRVVGMATELERKVPSRVPRYEYPDALVTPGFVDGHTHFMSWALGRGRVQLAGAGTREEAVRRVAGASPFLGWVLGQGWDANDWAEPPHRLVLDEVQAGPVFLDSVDVHSAWLNSAALAAAGIDRSTPDPFGGRIVRDALGDPTGLLQERAVELVWPHLPTPPSNYRIRMLGEAQAEAHRLGLTGIHDVEGPDALASFRRFEASGDLRLRVLFHPPVQNLSDLISHGVRSGAGSDWLALGGVKMFLDGSLGSRTAWMLQPYEDGRDSGMPITSLEEARAGMAAAAGAGLAVTVHAIGDAAVRRALDLMAPLPTAPLPHRIEHFQCVHPDDLDRAAAAGIVVSMQPAHILTDIPLAERRWGLRSRGAYAFRSLQRRGTPMVFGSDTPVASIDPREGVYSAMARQDQGGSQGAGWFPDEKMGFYGTVAAYTTGAAWAAGLSARRGALAAGFDADLVAWEVDPAVEREVADAFRCGRARLTVVAGEVVWSD